MTVRIIGKIFFQFFAVSRQFTIGEQRPLIKANTFSLVCGGLKVMDLIYCPFERKCASCDKRDNYVLTDENGRKFPLRRYRTSECRFELYNCANLAATCETFRHIQLLPHFWQIVGRSIRQNCRFPTDIFSKIISVDGVSDNASERLYAIRTKIKLNVKAPRSPKVPRTIKPTLCRRAQARKIRR